MLCVFLYVIESIIISVFIPEDTTFPSNSPSKESSSVDLFVFDNQQVNQQLLQTFDGVFVMYFFYLLSIDTLNKGFGSIKVLVLSHFSSDCSSSGTVQRLSISNRNGVRALQSLHVPHRVPHHSFPLSSSPSPSTRLLLSSSPHGGKILTAPPLQLVGFLLSSYLVINTSFSVFF